MTGRGGTAAIRYTLVNRGNTVLTPRLAVRADGLFGPVLRRAARTLPVELPPGQRGRAHRDAGPIAPALDAVDVRLTVTAGGGAHGAATASYTAAPWGVVAGPVLLLAAGAGGLAVVRRRRGPGPCAACRARTPRGRADEAQPCEDGRPDGRSSWRAPDQERDRETARRARVRRRGRAGRRGGRTVGPRGVVLAAGGGRARAVLALARSRYGAAADAARTPRPTDRPSRHGVQEAGGHGRHDHRDRHAAGGRAPCSCLLQSAART